MPDLTQHTRQIRSFIGRNSRLTAGQQRAIDLHWKQFGLDESSSLDPSQVFNHSAPLIIEIGFGNGEALAKIADSNPELNFIGIETHLPGIGHLLIEAEQRGLSNVRMYKTDAVAILDQCISDQSLAGVQIFFPDPWHKKRHKKRRLINPDFIHLIAQKLQTGGYLFIATDWADYANWIRKILLAEQCKLKPVDERETAEKPYIPERPVTKFETRGLKLGHSITEFKLYKP